MSDLISRQAAIDAIMDESIHEGRPSVYAQRILNLPSAQPTEASCWGCNCQKMERLKEQKTFSEMVHLHDAETHDKRTEKHSCDCISRQAALSEIDGFLAMDKHYHPHSQGKQIPVDEMRARLKNLPSAKPLYENITELKEHLERILASCSTEGDYNKGFAMGLSLYIDELDRFESKAQP